MTTDASLSSEESSETTYKGDVIIKTTCKAKCGGFGTGGESQAETIYTTNLHLSKPISKSNVSVWVVEFNVLGNYSSGLAVGRYSLNISNTNFDTTFNCVMNNTNYGFKIPQLAPGIYTVKFKCPRVLRACQGDPEGNVKESIFRTKLTIKAYLH